MTALPQDPSYSEGTTNGCYYYTSDGVDYKLYDTATEMREDYKIQPALLDPKRDGSEVDDCKVDGTNYSAWAIWSSCDASSTTACSASSCSW